MRGLLTLVVLMGTAGWTSQVHAACDEIKTGWIADSFQISAGELMTLSDVGLAAYVLGYSQGLLISVRAGSNRSCVDDLSRCTSGQSAGDLVDRLRRYVSERPTVRDDLASRVTFDAIFGPCFARLQEEEAG
jgi:hypothetical protein